MKMELLDILGLQMVGFYLASNQRARDVSGREWLWFTVFF